MRKSSQRTISSPEQCKYTRINPPPPYATKFWVTSIHKDKNDGNLETVHQQPLLLGAEKKSIISIETYISYPVQMGVLFAGRDLGELFAMLLGVLFARRFFLVCQ
jgi:hypothetical protein